MDFAFGPLETETESCGDFREKFSFAVALILSKGSSSSRSFLFSSFSSLILFLFLFHLSWDVGCSLVVVLRGVGLTGLLAWPLAEPLGQLGLGPLLPLIVLLLPQSLQVLGSHNFPAAFVQL